MPVFSDTTTENPRCKLGSAGTWPQALHTPLWPTTDEAAESSESESASSSDSDSDEPHAQPMRRSSPQRQTNTERAPVHLPQRPSLAITRDQKRSWLRNGASMRMGDSQWALLQNEGLALATPGSAASSHGSSRSEDRIRAAQRLFHALGQSSRMEHRTPPKEAPKRSRISILQGLRLQAQRRHSREVADAPPVRDREELSFSTNMQGTQHCVIAMESSTFELVVTPPTPRTDEHEWEGGAPITGVRLSSHKTAHALPPLPPSPQLQPPPFELAPGRAQQLAQRKQRQEQELNAWMALQEASTAQLRTQWAPSASADKMRMLTLWNAHMAEQAKVQGAQTSMPAFQVRGRDMMRTADMRASDIPKYVPPGRRRMNTTTLHTAPVSRCGQAH